MTTTIKGNQFRDQVGHLLRSANYDVKFESLIGSKKVDLLISKKDLGKTIRTAVECKDYNRTLRRSDVVEIYQDLASLLDDRKIERILLVTTMPIAPAAQAYIEERPAMAHRTFMELQNSLMDFTYYLNDLMYSYEQDQIEKYFFDPITTTGKLLEKEVERWLTTDGPPLAILASYGMGKTTFARHLAANFARDALQGSTGRIPVYLPLGEISSEQSLEGLLGKALSAKSVIENYHFHTFMKLNEMGRLLVFLDGFDEMKHAMTWDQFKFNFQQLNRLISDRSKVILLGRPSAFLSEEEYMWVLRGERSIGQQSLKMADWPAYKELDIAQLDEVRARDFLDRYIRFRPVKSGHRGRSVKAIKANIDAIPHPQFKEVLARPVHVKMLAEIAANGKIPVDELSITNLYSAFMDLTIDRELEKEGRQFYSSRQRREFAQNLAWWMWTENHGMSISAGTIPVQLIVKYKKYPDMDLEAVRRDLSSACCLESKLGGNLYFPHRSFQEFLVAEKLYFTDPRLLDFNQIMKSINGEIVNFLAGLGAKELKSRWIMEIGNYSGMASIAVFDFIRDGIPNPNQRDLGLWYPLLLVCGEIREAASGEADVRSISSSLMSYYKTTSVTAARRLALAAALLAGTRLSGAAREAMDHVFGALLLSSFDVRPSMISDQTGMAFFEENKGSQLLRPFASSTSVRWDDRNSTPIFYIPISDFLEISQHNIPKYGLHNIPATFGSREVIFTPKNLEKYFDQQHWRLINSLLTSELFLKKFPVKSIESSRVQKAKRPSLN